MSSLRGTRFGAQVTGRLAPTPSGYLHLGNARSFLLAWLWARHEHGRVIMRIEDIDRPRCKPELREAALNELAWLGLDWDAGPHAGEPVGVYDQSTQTEIYRVHLQKLAAAGLAYPCTCTRKDIEQASSAPHGDDPHPAGLRPGGDPGEGAIYPGTCRGRWQSFEHAKRESGIMPAWRFRFEGIWQFHDEVQGDVSIDASTLGDFVLWRRDDLPSYQLAVTVDDALQGVTQVLRGRDLVSSTARQLALYTALGLAAPTHWAHVPFIQDAQGRRMAKRDGAMALAHLRETGADPQKIVGLLAWSAGLMDEPTASSLQVLARDFETRRIRPLDYVVTAHDMSLLAS